MTLDKKLLQEICDQISGEIDAVVSIFAGKGEIVASSRRDRIGGFHAGAARIMAGEVNFYGVTAEEAAADGTMLEGSTHPIEYEGERLFCVGIAAPLQIATASSRIIQHWVVSLLRERALVWSEHRFRDVAESASDWIWEMDQGLRFTYLSPRFFEIFRVPPEAIIGKTRTEFAGPHDGDQAWRDHEAKLSSRLPFREFAYSATADGRVRYLKISGKPIYDPDGTFSGYRGTGCDITEQIEIERALKRSQQMLSEAIESIPEGFCFYDRDDRLVVFNSKYRTLLQYDSSVKIEPGMTFEAVARQAAESGKIRAAQGRVDEWVQNRLARRRELGAPHIQQRGENRWIMVSEQRTGDGGTVALYTDISEFKQRESELADKSNALEQLSNQLAKYLSPQIYDSIFRSKQEVKVASTRKKLTVFFSDIAGFTETADRLQSEELTQLLNHYLTEMSDIALRHGATIDKYIGDAIMIFFGDPETKGVKEDALSCVRMAIAMRKRMDELQRIWRDAGIEKPLRCRMGIHTDYCTVGNFGSEARMDYTIIGGAVNLASRLETAATPGDILISYETYAQVKDVIACVEQGNIDVKGKAYPVATYQVLDMLVTAGQNPVRYEEERPNFTVRLDLKSMSEEERRQAAIVLRTALEQVSNSGTDYVGGA